MKKDLLKTSALAAGVALALASMGAHAATQPSLATAGAATLLYHYFGDRIDSVGIEGAPDLIQEGYGELNFIFIKELNRNWQVTAKAKNILDVRSEITQGSLLTNGFNLGREASIQVQYRF